MDQADIHALEPGLPRHRALGLAHRLVLDAFDELPELGLRDGRIGARSLLVEHGREALHELARDPDDDVYNCRGEIVKKAKIKK
jgi:hypothetical protein